MERNAKFILGLIIIAFAVIAIGGYAYIQSREFLRGPQIIIFEPSDGDSFTKSPATISGQVQNVAYITLNDATVFPDSKGNFREKLLLLPGYNILTVKAGDRFGKRVEKTLELTYKALEEGTASSTPPEN